jgi:DUF4097 and DUF4098 domain-containing protein YvlB
MGTPPQYPPQNPRQYPPSQDPRQQVRDWARAQRDQASAQRQYWRYYWRAGRRGSITGPIILLTVGILALMVETGRLSGYVIWNWYAQWWPLLLIVIGLISLAEYFFDRDDPYARRRVGGGFVFLFILLVFLGLGAHGARHWGRQFGVNDNDFWFMFGEEHDNDIAMAQAAAANGTVNVQDPRGDVTVTPSADGQIHLRAHEVVHTSSDKEAEKEFDEVRPRMSVSGSNATISVPARGGTAVDLTLEIPEASFLVVNAGHGDVSVEGLKNHADVTDGHGDVKFDSIAGYVHAHMSDGDFSAHAIEGEVYVDGHADDVTLSEVKGQAVLDGEFFGDTHLEQMGGPVHFHSTRTQIDVPRLGGDLTLDSDDLSANQTDGPVRIVTHAKNIELTQTAGDLHIENGDGDVNVTAAAPLGNIEIANHTGALSLTVPENANFSVSANTTEDDDLETDFPLNVITNGDEKQITGMVGSGGVKLDLSTTHGNLELRKGSAEVASPSPSPSPAAPGRHLKAPKAPVTPTEQ